MRVCVVGLGKIGLPLAVQYAQHGVTVTGADIDTQVVAAVSDGVAPFPGETDLDGRLKKAVAAGDLTATTDIISAVAGSDVVVVVVPLYVDDTGAPDFAALDSATGAVGAGMRPGTLVCFETTLPVGTTRGRFAPGLRNASGLRAGEEFFLAFSPERVSSGRIFADLRQYPKLVGGVDEESARRAREFYSRVLDFDTRTDLPRPNGVWDLGCAEAAELAKLAETTYRDVNIALVNQFTRYADTIGVDIAQVIAACNSQPFSQLHAPGIAVGGHCIPVYPRLYLWNDGDASVVDAARRANEAMPSYAVRRLAEVYGSLAGSRVLVLGAAYRGGVKETAYSGVFPLVEELRANGCDVYVSDPLYTAEELEGLDLPAHRGQAVDIAVVHTDHWQYHRLGAADVPGLRVLLDGRRVTDPRRWESVDHVVLGAPTRWANRSRSQ